MIIKGEPIPAVIGVTTATEDQSDAFASTLSSPIFFVDQSEYSWNGVDFQNMVLSNLMLSQRTTEKITAYPGITNKEQTFFQTAFKFIYLAGGNVHQVTFLVRTRLNSDSSGDSFTDDYINSNFPVGSRYRINGAVFRDTSPQPINQEKLLDEGQTDVNNPDIATCYIAWGSWEKLFAKDEVKNLLTTSVNPITIRQGIVVTQIIKIN